MFWTDLFIVCRLHLYGIFYFLSLKTFVTNVHITLDKVTVKAGGNWKALKEEFRPRYFDSYKVNVTP